MRCVGKVGPKPLEFVDRGDARYLDVGEGAGEITRSIGGRTAIVAAQSFRAGPEPQRDPELRGRGRERFMALVRIGGVERDQAMARANEDDNLVDGIRLDATYTWHELISGYAVD